MSQRLILLAVSLGLMAAAGGLLFVTFVQLNEGSGPQRVSGPPQQPGKSLPPQKVADERSTPSSDYPSEGSLSDALSQKVDLSFRAVSLRQFLDSITGQTKIKFRVDPKISQSLYGVKDPLEVSLPETIPIRGISVRTALRLVLKEQNLEFFVDDDRIEITATSEMPTVMRVYDVLDLITPNPADANDDDDPDRFDYDSLIDLITSTCDPSSWPAGTGPGPIYPYHGTLSIPQYSNVQDQIARLLTALRRARNLKPEDFAAGEGIQASGVGDQKVLESLDTKIDLQLTKASAEQAAEAIAARAAIPVYLDPEALPAVRGADATLNINAHQEPLRSVLDKLFSGSNLNYVVQNDVLVITLRESSKFDMYVVRIYQVGDLMNRVGGYQGAKKLDDNYTNLENLIKRNVRPSSWVENNGGNGIIGSVPCARALVCIQTREVHAEIARFLTSLRAAVAQNGKPAAAKRQVVAKPKRSLLSVRFYVLKNGQQGVSADQFVAVVRDLIEPKSWTGGEAYIHGVPGAIVVKQTAEIHHRVGKLLVDLGAIYSPYGSIWDPTAKPAPIQAGGGFGGGAF